MQTEKMTCVSRLDSEFSPPPTLHSAEHNKTSEFFCARFWIMQSVLQTRQQNQITSKTFKCFKSIEQKVQIDVNTMNRITVKQLIELTHKQRWFFENSSFAFKQFNRIFISARGGCFSWVITINICNGTDKSKWSRWKTVIWLWAASSIQSNYLLLQLCF